jgi:hypothetical protein
VWVGWFFAVVDGSRQSSTGITYSRETEDQDFFEERKFTSGRSWSLMRMKKGERTAS